MKQKTFVGNSFVEWNVSWEVIFVVGFWEGVRQVEKDVNTTT